MKRLHLLFVYNADAGLFSSVTDFVHKIISPATYNCSLCKLTYGNLAMKQQWKQFLENLPADKTFLHKNEFEKQYAQSFPLPSIFYLQENQPVELMNAAEINTCPSLEQLQEAVSNQVKTLLYD